MLMLNDFYPIDNHRETDVIETLRTIEKDVSCVLLDLQRPDERETENIVSVISNSLSCPIGISHHYALPERPVFVPPIPPDMTAEKYLKSWKGQEIWLELSCECLYLSINNDGCMEVSTTEFSAPEHYHKSLIYHYKIRKEQDRIFFAIYRTKEDNLALLEEAAQFGVTKGIGMWRDLA